MANQAGKERKTIVNNDTGWSIQVSGKVFTETTHHESTKSKKAVPYLEYINSIVQNAILLDSTTIPRAKAKSPNSVMVHHLYAVVDMGNGKEVLKLDVEELNNVNSDGTINRAYKLMLPAASVRVRNIVPSSITKTASNIDSVADLFKFVKKFDEEFQLNQSSVILNNDNEPRIVYHGTNSKFNVFDMSKGRANMDIRGAFFSPWEYEARGYGENVGAYYLSIKNPADGPTAFAALNRFKGQNNAGEKARDYLIRQGYDGVNFYGEEYVAFYPTQIKSATDNIGLFDKNNPDIRFSFSSPKSDTAQMNIDAATDVHFPKEAVTREQVFTPASAVWKERFLQKM